MDKTIYLTFDDGPDPLYTPQILDILRQESAKATFFVCGEEALKNPGIIKRIVKEGHTLANHGFSHSRKVTSWGFPGEYLKTNTVLNSMVGQKIKYFRVPWGIPVPWLTLYLKTKGLDHKRWTFTTRDWETSDPEKIAKIVFTKARDKAVVLMHDGAKGDSIKDRSGTVKALLPIISALKSRGYKFASL